MRNESIEHFKNLLKINTANPPGREMEAIVYLKKVLEKAGLQVFVQETSASAQNPRGNLVVRVKGSGDKKPLLIQSHVDVVNVEPQYWKHDPFAAIEDDGCIYGRGAIDMKNFTAMCLTSILRAHREKWPMKRDLIMAAVSDEEAGAQHGMIRLVNEAPEMIRAEYALGEVGGYTLYVQGRPYYPVQVGEKGVLWLEVTLKGEPGHGSVPRRENVHWRLSRFLNRIENKAFPYHATTSFHAFVDGLQRNARGVEKISLNVLKSRLAPRILKARAQAKKDAKAEGLLAMMTNTANPTGIVSGRQMNVVPSTVTLKLDCRVIPGVAPDIVIREIEQATGEKLDYKIVQYQPGHESPIETPLFRAMCRNLEEAHSGATAVPWLTVGFTDASHLQKLGIICYGFTPVRLPPDLDFAVLYHGHNERIPVDGFLWGVDVFTKTVKEFCCS